MSVGSSLDETDDDSFMPEWVRAFNRCVKAGTMERDAKSRDAFLVGWTAGQNAFEDRAKEEFGKLLKGWLR